MRLSSLRSADSLKKTRGPLSSFLTPVTYSLSNRSSARREGSALRTSSVEIQF